MTFLLIENLAYLLILKNFYEKQYKLSTSQYSERHWTFHTSLKRDKVSRDSDIICYFLFSDHNVNYIDG